MKKKIQIKTLKDAHPHIEWLHMMVPLNGAHFCFHLKTEQLW